MRSPLRSGIGAVLLLLFAILLRVFRGQLSEVLAPSLHATAALFAAGLALAAIPLGLLAIWQLRRTIGSFARAVIRALDDLDDRLLASTTARRTRFRRALAVFVFFAALANLLVETTQIEQGWEARFVDRFFGLRFPEVTQAAQLADNAQPSTVHLNEVAVVALDDDSIARLGWPLPRHLYARLIEVITAADPASLSFDISLLDPSREHPEADLAIGEAAARSKRVYFTYTLSAHSREGHIEPTENGLRVLRDNALPWNPQAAKLRDYSRLVRRPVTPRMVIDAIATRTHGVALANVSLDGDDVLRHALLVARHGSSLLPSLSLRLAADALGVPLSAIRIVPGSHLEIGDQRRVPIDAYGRTLIRYQGRPGTWSDGPVRYFPLWTLLRSELAITLAGNPLGEDQEFLLEEGLADLSSLREGLAVQGLALYSKEPGQIVEIAPDSAPRDETAPSFEVLDETRMRFRARIAKLRRLGAKPQALKGRHVLIGATALATWDLHSSPLGAIPGVEYHATMLANLLRGDFFREAPWPVRVGVTCSTAFLAALAGAMATPGLGFLLGSLLLFGVLLAGFGCFSAGIHLPMVAPLVALLGAYGAGVLLGFRAEGRARARAEAGREFARRTFGRYMTDEVAQQILDSPDGLRLGGQRRFITIMMTDLRGFTTMCSELWPENVVQLINHYLEVMTRIINSHHGTIEEFIGDAILVLFGAPLAQGDEEPRAVACALAMQNAMGEINRWNQEHGLPEVEMGIGIHSGEVVLGNIGSELRAKYSAIGSTVNLASRVESYTVGGQVLISETTKLRCQDRLSLGTSQTLTPKGVKGTLTVHEVLAVGAPYDIALQSGQDDPQPLRRSLRVRYAPIKEKHVGELQAAGDVVALSRHAMELTLDAALELHANLLLRIVDPDDRERLLPGDLYAKVTRNLGGGRVYLRLTSVPLELRGFIKHLLTEQSTTTH